MVEKIEAVDTNAEPMDSGAAGTEQNPDRDSGGDGKDEGVSIKQLLEDEAFKAAFDEQVGRAVAEAKAEWEKSMTTDNEQELLKRAEAAERELTELKQHNALRDKHVLEQFRGFVMYEISKLPDIPFDEALDRVIALNRWVSAPFMPGSTTGMPQGAPLSAKSGVERAFAEKNPGLKFD